MYTLSTLFSKWTNLATNTVTESHFSALGQNLCRGEDIDIQQKTDSPVHLDATHTPFPIANISFTHSALFPQSPISKHTTMSEVFHKAGNSLVIHIRDKRSPTSAIISYLVDLDKEQSKAGILC